jgi:hypothetical protein
VVLGKAQEFLDSCKQELEKEGVSCMMGLAETRLNLRSIFEMERSQHLHLPSGFPSQ